MAVGEIEGLYAQFVPLSRSRWWRSMSSFEGRAAQATGNDTAEGPDLKQRGSAIRHTLLWHRRSLALPESA